MKECVFCQEGKDRHDRIKDEPIKILGENESFWAKPDPRPVSKGHTLIISKRHIVSFLDLNENELKDFYDLLKKVTENLKKEFNFNDFNIGINDGRAAGRTVDHLHIHIIPRYEGDVENPRGGVRHVIPGKGDYKE